MNIEARRIAPPRRARFFRFALLAAALAAAATASAAMLDSGGSIETFDGLSAALPPSATTDRLLATSSTTFTISGLTSQRGLSGGTSPGLTGLAGDADPTDVATTNPTPAELPDPLDALTTPSTLSLLYAPLAAGALYCCFGWTTTRFKRRPIRSSTQTADGAVPPDLDLVALRAARHNSSDSIAA
jgi:hypothetical protein